MKVAVIYESKTGNTRKMAETLFESINGEKVICDIEKEKIPNADFYFIGFGIHNQNCSMHMAEVMEQISGAGYALFISCGYIPIEKYRERVLKNITVWLPDNAEYTDTFMCQGKVCKSEQKIIIWKNQESAEMLHNMFERGENHPDREDLESIKIFAKEVLSEWSKSFSAFN